MYNLFLDDVRQPMAMAPNPLYTMEEWIVVKNFEEFVGYITDNGLPEMVSFDHDLADIHYNPSTQQESFQYRERTGYDCAKWLVAYCMAENKLLPKYLCHSANPVGKENILILLNNFKTQRS